MSDFKTKEYTSLTGGVDFEPIGQSTRNSINSGICGQAPSDYPEIAEFLVELGIESMSLNPDTVVKMTRHVLDVQARR